MNVIRGVLLLSESWVRAEEVSLNMAELLGNTSVHYVFYVFESYPNLPLLAKPGETYETYRPVRYTPNVRQSAIVGMPLAERLAYLHWSKLLQNPSSAIVLFADSIFVLNVSS